MEALSKPHFPKIARKQNSRSKLHKDKDFKVAPLLKVAFCQHQKKIVSLQFEISNYYVHVHSFVLCTYFWLPMPLVNHCNSKGQLFEGRKIWKMIALDVSEWTIIIFQNGACTVCQINGGPSAVKHTKNALVTQI